MTVKPDSKTQSSQNQPGSADEIIAAQAGSENVETHRYQADVSRALQILISNVYSNEEIFLRELISNASDAIDKVRLDHQDLHYKIMISGDEEAGTLTISDNGIGMNHDDMIRCLGTIAHSGTREFIEQMSKEAENNQIGQFGLGFYAAFMVAERISVHSRRHDADASEGYLWSSDGGDQFQLESMAKEAPGTTVTLFLKSDKKDYAKRERIETIVHKYSDDVIFDIFLNEDEEKTNSGRALWSQPKSAISDEQYKQFYQSMSHDIEDPLGWSHQRVEGKYDYTALLYLPKKAPFDLWMREGRRGLKLYVQRVFIMDASEHFLPGYLRFVRGVIDANDLPLNISREILQKNEVIDHIRAGCTKKILSTLKQMADKNPEDYQAFWNEFGAVIKEAPGEDFINREAVFELLRFASTHDGQATQTVSLQAYIDRMPEGQDAIYYITADSHKAAVASPHLEIFRQRGIEVLLLSDRVDEWLVSHLSSFKDKPLKSVVKGEIGDLDFAKSDEEKAEDKAKEEALEADLESMITQMKSVLEGKVKDVRISHRLTDSPTCLIADENDMSSNLKRLLKEAGQAMPETQPILEINPTHPLIKRIKAETSDDVFAQWSQVLFNQAILAEGGQLEDPGVFIQSLNQLLEKS